MAAGGRIIRADALVRVPWNNGGGTTAQLAACPEGAGMADFGWRLSMADVAADGPFSRFPGVDRTLVLVEGQGLWLDVGCVSSRLDEGRRMLTFSGETDTVARLVEGPIRDFNVMTRREAFRHHVWIAGPGASEVGVAAGFAAVLALEPMTVGGAHRLGRLDCLLLEPKAAATLTLSGRAVLVGIHAVA